MEELEWMEKGSCTWDVAELFFPGQGQNGRKAAAICATCPVRQECYDFGVETDSTGVWGGVLFREEGEPIRYV